MIITYYILLTLINFYLLLKNKKELPILFYLIGILSNAVMLLSPTWGYRTSFASYLFLSISFLIVIDQYIKNKLDENTDKNIESKKEKNDSSKQINE